MGKPACHREAAIVVAGSISRNCNVDKYPP
jgi:hypothetical protein